MGNDVAEGLVAEKMKRTDQGGRRTYQATRSRYRLLRLLLLERRRQKAGWIGGSSSIPTGSRPRRSSNKESPVTRSDDSKKGAKGISSTIRRPYLRREASDIITFQFADLSPVFPGPGITPFRSLGTAIRRLPSPKPDALKFNEAVFEGLMMYMRVKSGDDVERA